MSLASDPPQEESRCDGGSDGSARGGDTSNGASLQHWRRPPPQRSEEWVACAARRPTGTDDRQCDGGRGA